MNLKLSLVASLLALSVVACGDDDDGGSTAGTAGTGVAGASGSTSGTSGAAGSTAGTASGASGNAGASGAAGATGTETFSCDHHPSECDEYDNVTTNNVELVKGLCSNGTPGTACTTDGLVGKCTSPGGLANLVQFFYVGDPDSLKESCENDGTATWSTP